MTYPPDWPADPSHRRTQTLAFQALYARMVREVPYG